MKWKYQLRGLGFGIIISALIMGIFNHSKEMTDEEIKQKARELGMTETVALGDLVTPESTIEIVVKEPDSSSESFSVVDNKEVSVESTIEESESMPESEEYVPESSEEGSIETSEGAEPESTEESVETSTEDMPESSEAESSEVESSEIETQEPESTQSIEESKEPETSVAESSEELPKDGVATITISSGDSSTSVCKKLKKAGLIEDEKAYDDFLGQNKYDRHIMKGTYEIPFGASDEEIAQIITKKQ